MGNFFATMCCKTSSKIEASVFFIVLAIFVFFLITLCCKFLVRRLDEFLFEGTPPLHRSFIADLPIFPYRRNPKSEIIECSICLGEFNDGDMVRALPNCAHLFHQQCIDTWLARCGSCPTCRAPVEPECLVYDAQPVRVVVDVPPSPSASTPSMMSSPSVYSSPLNMIVDSTRTTNRAYFDEYDDVVDIRLA